MIMKEYLKRSSNDKMSEEINEANVSDDDLIDLLISEFVRKSRKVIGNKFTKKMIDDIQKILKKGMKKKINERNPGGSPPVSDSEKADMENLQKLVKKIKGNIKLMKQVEKLIKSKL